MIIFGTSLCIEFQKRTGQLHNPRIPLNFSSHFSNSGYIFFSFVGLMTTEILLLVSLYTPPYWPIVSTTTSQLFNP